METGDNDLPRSGTAPNKMINPEKTPEIPAAIGKTIPRRCCLGVGFKGLVRSSTCINRVCSERESVFQHSTPAPQQTAVQAIKMPIAVEYREVAGAN
jgi:hypothetical protein